MGPKWETVTDGTQRLEVPGGWVYLIRGANHPPMAILVPKPDTWEGEPNTLCDGTRHEDGAHCYRRYGHGGQHDFHGKSTPQGE